MSSGSIRLRRGRRGPWRGRRIVFQHGSRYYFPELLILGTDISAKVVSDSFHALATESALNTAATLVSLQVTTTILAAGHQTTANLCESWLIDQMQDNIVEIHQGSSVMRFTKSPDGSYNPPLGQTLRLTTEGAGGNWRLKNSKGIFYDFDANGKLDAWSDAFGNVVDFSYDGYGKLNSVAGKIGGSTTSRTLSFTYTNDRITSVSDSANRSISYEYNANGELTSYANPDGNEVTYAYDGTNKGQLTEIYSPVDAQNPFLTIVYDTLGRMQQQIDANDVTWDFYRATYRNEVLPPAQVDPNGNSGRFGSSTWANPENRKVTTKDGLGHKTTTTYDAQARPEAIVGPAGTALEFTYSDSQYQVQGPIQVDSLSIPGSDDPNVLRKAGYSTYEDGTTGRWFIDPNQTTDVTDKKTYYHYDYNDVGTYGSALGRLMKVVGPNTPAGRPSVEYTYNSYGQLETQTDPNGMLTRFEYYTAAEGGGLKKTIVDYGTGTLNLTTELTYDSVGRVLTAKDPRGNTSTNEYHASGRLKKTTAPSPFSYVTTYEYYADGKLKCIKQGSSGGGGGGNDFSSDPNCVALYRVESGALTTDSQGTNTLTNEDSHVTANTSDYQQGSASAQFQLVSGDWEKRNWLTRADADLSAKFPGKGGTSYKRFSICLWAKFASLPSGGNAWPLVTKANWGNNRTTYAVTCESGGYFGLRIGDGSGQQAQTLTHGSALTTGRWYHIGVTFDDASHTGTIRVWDDTAEAILGTDASKTDFLGMGNTSDAFRIGSVDGLWYACTDGRMDEVVVLNDLLTTTQIDAIRQASYGGGGGGGGDVVYLKYYTYNNRGQKATERGPYPANYTQDEYAVNYTQYAYDALGRLWKVTDAEGNITTTRYWPDNQVWKVIDAKGNNAVVKRYNSDGSLKEIEDARGNITKYEYNGFKGLKKTIYPNYSEPNDNREEITYDQYRRVSQTRGRSGQTIEFTYDDAGRVATKTVKKPDESTFNTITYTYDLLGRLYEVEDNTGTTKNTFDKAGRLIRVEYPGSRTVSYQYDAASNRTRLTYPDSTYITYDYDQLNRMTAVRNQAGTALASYSFDERSRRTGLDYVNGAYADYSYDAASRLLILDNQTGNGQHKYAYTYDKVGNRMTMTVTDSGGPRTHVYAYDDIYQITDVNYPVGFDYLATDTQFNYDAAGNRTSVIDGSGTASYTTNSLNQYTAAGPDSFQYDASGNMWADGHNVYTFDPENRLLTARKSGQSPPPGSALAEAVDSGLSYTTGGDANWQKVNYPYHYGDDSAEGTAWRNGNSWLATEVEGAGTLKFWWKVSSESGGDYLEFYIDDQLQSNPISGEQDWAEKTYTLGSGTHTLRWQYTKDDDDETAGDDRGWVDYVQWSGQQPQPEEWDQVEYVYDPAGRRIEKKYDGATVYKYIYDGDHCIAEYDASGVLARKYVYGPAVDEPISMIESSGAYAGTYYYHFDALGSVVALSSGNVADLGDTVAVYEYDVYGRVGASDANHPNRFLFTGREFDKETGLYYYRARYYNPQIGRFLQTDPIGYGGGMNWYAYCGNNSTNSVDPWGLLTLYVYNEYAEGIYSFFKLSPSEAGVEWNVAGIASVWGVDPSRLEAANFAGYGTGYVIRGGSTGYSDPSGTAGRRDEIVLFDPPAHELSDADPLSDSSPPNCDGCCDGSGGETTVGPGATIPPLQAGIGAGLGGLYEATDGYRAWFGAPMAGAGGWLLYWNYFQRSAPGKLATGTGITLVGVGTALTLADLGVWALAAGVLAPVDVARKQGLEKVMDDLFPGEEPLQGLCPYCRKVHSRSAPCRENKLK